MSSNNLGEGLLRYSENQHYLFFDTETENLNSFYSKPWQLSFAICKGKKVLEEYDYFLDWPSLHISADAKRITKFDEEKFNRLKGPPEIAINKFEEYLYDPKYRIVGANILSFDTYQLNTARRLLGKKPDFSYIDRIIDTHLLQKAILLSIKPDLDNFIIWQYKMDTVRQKGLKTSQIACAKHFGIEFDPETLHDALTDIRLNMDIFFQQIWGIEI